MFDLDSVGHWSGAKESCEILKPYEYEATS